MHTYKNTQYLATVLYKYILLIQNFQHIAITVHMGEEMELFS